jgi:hypothetical protein
MSSFNTVLDAIKEYQCPGCAGGLAGECYEKNSPGVGCSKHCPGSIMSSVGTIFLGMEKGFNRLGPVGYKDMPIVIFENEKQSNEEWDSPSPLIQKTANNLYDNFNIAVWKYLDKFGSTIVRGLSPRMNAPFLHVYLKDVRDQIDCLEITEDDVSKMD